VFTIAGRVGAEGRGPEIEPALGPVGMTELGMTGEIGDGLAAGLESGIVLRDGMDSMRLPGKPPRPPLIEPPLPENPRGPEGGAFS
jgi:hypothetical protein